MFAIAFAIVVAFAFRRPAAIVAAPTPVRTDPGAVVESTGGRVERFKLSHEDVRVEYQKQLTYADGSTKMLGVTIITEDRGGRSFTMTGKEGQIAQKESAISLNGAVNLVASDGLTVKTEHAAYNDSDGVVRGEGPVEFVRGRLSGSGIGMTYDKDNDVLQILDKAVMHVAGDAKGAGKVSITSGTAGLARARPVCALRARGENRAGRAAHRSDDGAGLSERGREADRIDRAQGELQGHGAQGRLPADFSR